MTEHNNTDLRTMFRKHPLRALLAVLVAVGVWIIFKGVETLAEGFTCEVCETEYVGGRWNQSICEECRAAQI